jgi:hypothetical protein
MGRYFANLDATSEPAYAIKKRLARLHRKAQALIDDLGGAFALGYVFMALTDPSEPAPSGFGHPNRRSTTLKLNQCIKALTELAAWLKNAAGRIPKDKTGDKTGAAHFVTEGVAELLARRTTYKLTVGRKHPDPGLEFLDGCFDLLGIRVQADSMVRWLVAQRRDKVPLQKT